MRSLMRRVRCSRAVGGLAAAAIVCTGLLVAPLPANAASSQQGSLGAATGQSATPQTATYPNCQYSYGPSSSEGSIPEVEYNIYYNGWVSCDAPVYMSGQAYITNTSGVVQSDGNAFDAFSSYEISQGNWDNVLVGTSYYVNFEFTLTDPYGDWGVAPGCTGVGTPVIECHFATQYSAGIND